MSRHRLPGVLKALALAGLLVLAWASVAQAAKLYAVPSATSEACTQVAPCSLRQAVTESETNDEVIIGNGDYSIDSRILARDGSENVYIHGEFGGPMPRIFASLKEEPLGFRDTGGRLSWVEIVNEAPGAFGASCPLGGIVERVRLQVRGKRSAAIRQGPGCDLRDAVLRADGMEATALYVADGETSKETKAQTRNVTAIATGPESIGARAEYLGVGPIMEVNLILRNSIVSGALYDLYTYSFADPARIYVSNSNFDSAEAVLPHGVITIGEANQSAPPLFIDPIAGDYREAPGSPTIDAGFAEVPDFLDAGGGPRILGEALDIGAYEFAPSTQPPPPPTPIGRLRSLKLSPSRFSLSGAVGDPAGKLRAPGGTLVTYGVTADTRVHFTIEAKTEGRLVKGRCRKLTRSNAYGKKCSLLAPLKGSIRRFGRTGTNSFRFLGRFEGEELEPGAYRLVATAGGGTIRVPFQILGDG